jgi:hypothetical protein
MKRIPSEKVCKAPDCSNVYLQYKSTQKVCSVQCAIALAKEKAYQKKLTEARIAKREWHEKNITVQKLVGKVQREYFNPWIRRRDKGKKCISCNVILEGKYDAGHYYPSTHFSLRFDEANVHGQCVKCNQYLHGNLRNWRTSCSNIPSRKNDLFWVMLNPSGDGGFRNLHTFFLKKSASITCGSQSLD